MKKNIFKFLKLYSTQPFEVDKLIISSFIFINNLTVNNNRLLQAYLISNENIDEYDYLMNFIVILKKDLLFFNIEELIELFEFVISPSDRVVNGAIYTPLEIREFIIDYTFKTTKTIEASIADISCGCGGFLATATKALKRSTGKTYSYIYENKIFGLDIQHYSIIRAKLLLSLLALADGEDEIEFKFNLFQGDALTFKWKSYFTDFQGFNIIVGNPPYVCARNLDDKVKANLKNWSVCKTGNQDLYIPFFQIGFENLASGGILGYITMNTFFKSLNGRALRTYFKQNNLEISIIDFGTNQIFKSKSTYTCICFIENNKSDFVKYYKSKNKELPKNVLSYNEINYGILDSVKGWNLDNNKIISKIESTGRPFGNLYKTRHGIATLRNDIFIFKPIQEDNDYYYLLHDDIFPIEKTICKDIINPSRLSRKVKFNDIKEKVIFPYNDSEKPKPINELEFQKEYPSAYKYLLQRKFDLSKRDKGQGNYPAWFAFGRTQSLDIVRNKLFFPKMIDKNPNYVINSDDDLLFYNGQAIIGHTFEEMLLIKKIMESRLFWYYIKSTSKPYSSDYYSLDSNYIRNFGIYNFTKEDINYIFSESDQNIFNEYLEDKYKIQINI